MKLLHVTVCTALFLLPLPCAAQFRLVPYDAATMQFPVTPEQAMAAARQWAGDPSLALELRGVDREPTLFHADYYILRSPDSQDFRIDCYRGCVRRWANRPAGLAYHERHRQDAISPLPRLPAAQHEEIALGWASAHYPNFNQLNMQLGYGSDGDGYVAFATRIPGGMFFSGNQCEVNVDPFVGEVYNCWALTSGPVTISTQPQITAAQAEGIALNSYAPYPVILSAFTEKPTELHVVLDSLDQQRLVWGVFTAASDEANYTLAMWEANSYLGAFAYTVEVDAVTGQILRHDASDQRLGGPGSKPGRVSKRRWRSRTVHFAARRAGQTATRRELDPATIGVAVDGREVQHVLYPPLLRDGAVYWYAGYLKSPLWRMSVRRDGDSLTIRSREGRRIVLRDGSRTARIHGETIPTELAPVVIAGRTYLPLSTWEQVTGSALVWEPEKKRVMVWLAARGGSASSGLLQFGALAALVCLLVCISSRSRRL